MAQLTHTQKQSFAVGMPGILRENKDAFSGKDFNPETRATELDGLNGTVSKAGGVREKTEADLRISVAAGTVRFMAIDGVVEPKVKLAASGLDPKLTQLFPDGRCVRQRRLAYRPDFVGSPFYKIRQQILETDIPAAK